MLDSRLSDTPTISDEKKSPAYSQLAVSFVLHLALMLTLLGVSQWVLSTVFSPDTFFDFSNLFEINAAGRRQLLLIAFFPLALFLAWQAGHQWIGRRNLPVTWRAATMTIAAFVTFFAGMALPAYAQPYLALITGFALLISALFDVFSRGERPDFNWTILSVIIFSGFIAWLLYAGSEKRDESLRKSYAESLAFARDTAMAEPALAQLQRKIESDARLPFLLNPWPLKPSADTLRRHLSRLSFGENYLFQHYRLKVFAFDRDDEAPLVIDQTESRSQMISEWEKAQTIERSADVRWEIRPDGTQRYLLRAKVNRMQDPQRPVDFICAFDQTFTQPTQAYSYVFDPIPFKNLSRLDHYEFALRRGNQMVAELGRILPETIARDKSAGTVETLHIGDRTDAYAKSADGMSVAVVGRQSTGIIKAIYLTCILFTFSSVALFLLAWSGAALGRLTFLPSTKGSLARRFQYAALALLAAGFLVLGLLTYFHFRKTANETRRAEFDFRAEAMLSQMRQTGRDMTPGSDSLKRMVANDLARTAASLSADVNYYDHQGRLLFTSRDDLRQIGLLPDQMPRTAFADLASGKIATLELEENVGQKPLTLRYATLFNRYNQPLGFLAAPFGETSRGVGAEVSDFIGMLSGIYVFLLFLAVVGTRALAGTVISPIKLIAKNIKTLQLEDRNQPLPYKGDAEDELGALVGEYNRMVDKLEESKVQLVRLERESAWREMARQIAHDIKNPLTTMKLSMQQLERVSNDPEQASAYLKRATSRLIEQIDSLAQTASEFSMFANLDMKNRAEVSLNNIVESVYDLFTEQHEAKLSLQMPQEEYRIMADKNHLLRVFNNLIINAIQAIPSDRKGQVKLELGREGNMAFVRISDNGGGIPHEIQDRVFEPNFTTKTSGSGLGLAICKKIIEAHDGDIRFTTRENEGTDFFVEIPVV